MNVKKYFKLKNLANVIGVCIAVLMIPILIVNVTLIVKSYMYPDAVHDFFGYKPFIVMSGSMSPTLQIGDLVIVKDTSISNVKVRDIVTYRTKGDIAVTHRVVGIADDGTLEIQGDANNTVDSLRVSEDTIEGVLVSKFVGLGSFMMFLQTPLGLLVSVVLPLLIFLLIDVVSKTKSRKKEREKQESLMLELERLKGIESKI